MSTSSDNVDKKTNWNQNHETVDCI